MSNNIYNILGKLKAITDTAALTPESSVSTPIYESVAPKGDIMEAVKSLESKFATFKEGKLDDLRDAQAAKKEADADKYKASRNEKSSGPKVVKGRAYGADKEEKDDLDESATTLSKGSKATYKDFAGETVNTTLQSDLTTDSQGKKGYYVGNGKTFIYANKVKPIKEGKLDDLRDAQAEKKAKADAWDIKPKKEAPKTSRTVQGKSYGAKVNESNYDVRQDGDVWYVTEKIPGGTKDVKRFDSATDEYAADNARQYANRLAAQKRTGRLEVEEGVTSSPRGTKSTYNAGQRAIKNIKSASKEKEKEKQEKEDKKVAESFEDRLEQAREKAAAKGLTKDKAKDEKAKLTRDIKGRSYGSGKEEKNDLDESTNKEDFRKKVSTASKVIKPKTAGEKAAFNKLVKSGYKDKNISEVAPPGKKAERMVKHIKKGYANDGKLTKKEKGIAYATAWKAKKAGKLGEATQFSDTVKNSKAELKKAPKAKLKESRMLQEGDYFYEKLAKALAEKDPTLDTSSPDFVTAVRHEMVAHGIEPNRARNIIMMDEDFIGDVATSYGHYCKEISETLFDPAQSNIKSPSNLEPITTELDEIAKLAGITKPLPAGTGSEDTLNELETDELDQLADYDANIDAEFDGDQLADYDATINGESRRYSDFDEWLDAVAMASNDRYTLEQDGDTQHAYQTNDEGNSFYSPEELIGAWDDLERSGVVYETDDLNEELELSSGWKLVSPSLLAGTSKVGKLDSTINPELVFGPPNGTSGDGKASQLWAIEFDDGTIASIYDYHGTRWSVGGLDRNAFYKVSDAIDSANAELSTNGNEFTEAMELALEDGSKDFEVDGQKYTVKEDISVNVTANGEEDTLNLFRKLAGLAPVEHSVDELDIDSDIDEAREIEFSNTPREKVAPTKAAIPSGTDLNRSKRQDPQTANRAANPLTQEAEQVDEAKVSALWNKYAGMLKSLLK